MNLSNKNIVHVKTDNVEYIQFKRLLEYKNIAHCYTLKSDGQLNFKTENNPIMLKSYENISKELEFTDIIKPMQKHTDNVLTIQGKQELDGVDGLITNIKNVTLATTSADCISLLFYDPNKNVIANVHSGWRGTEKGISKITVEKMMNEFKCNPEDIICCICPSIRRCHFEVDTDVKVQQQTVAAVLGLGDDNGPALLRLQPHLRGHGASVQFVLLQCGFHLF